MEQVHRVKASVLIEEIKEFLKKNGDVVFPENSDIIKTSHGKEQAPEDPDWFLGRMSAIARQAMRLRTISLKGLVKRFSCRKNIGVRPSRHANGSKFVNESAVEQLIKIGWFNFANKDSVLTPAAKEILGDIMDKIEQK